MGHKVFGKLAHTRGLIYHGLSPMEQKAFTGVLFPGMTNIIRRFRSKVFLVGVPLILSYAVYDWGSKKNHEIFRKHPEDYENDE